MPARMRTGRSPRTSNHRSHDGLREHLHDRLETVAGCVAGVARGHTAAEDLHQLRVASRRAIAGLRMTRDLLPARPRRWFHRRLRRILRATGRVRDIDVIAGHLAAGLATTRSARGARLAALLSAARRSAERPLRRLATRFDTDEWRIRTDRLVACIGHGDPPPWELRDIHRRLADDLAGFHRRLRRRPRRPTALHRLRLVGKQLRYCLEFLTTPLTGQPATECCAVLHTLQDRLGAYTDHAAAWRIARRLKHAAAGDRERTDHDFLRRAERTAARRARKTFSDWWTAARRREVRRACRRLSQEVVP